MGGAAEILNLPSRAAGTDELVLEVPPDPEHVRTARLFAAAAARHFGIDEEAVEDLKVAISEACTNAINAHRQAGVSDAVRVIVVPDGDRVRFTVTDWGPGFDPATTLSAGEDYTPPAGLSEGTLGLALIRALFPQVEIERNPERGMTISIPVAV